jgi:DHA1 family multidrug resistance protein-like MFS transporter
VPARRPSGLASETGSVGRDHQIPAYWRNQLAATFASFIGFTGFTLVMPFLPLYFRQLGVATVGEIALWSGLSLGVTPALTALVAPFWGRLGDRVGKKLMVERSLLSFVVVMTALAYVTRAWHVVALRAVQGLFAGYGALTVTMAAESAPPGRLAAAIGMVQTAQRLGPALGPVIGGALAGLVGLRRAFLVAAACYAVAAVLVAVLYRDPPRPGGGVRTGARSARSPWRRAREWPDFGLLMIVVFGLQLVDRSFGPILPLFVASLGVALDRVPLVAGSVFSIVAASGAVGNLACGPLVARVAPSRLIAASGALAAAAAASFAWVDTVRSVVPAAAVFGAALGVASTATYTAAGRIIPPGEHGTGFGVLTSAALVGVALSPVISGVLATAALRLVFLLDAVALLALAGLVSRLMVGPSEKAAVPVVEEP